MWRVRIDHHFAIAGIGIAIGQRNEGGLYVAEPVTLTLARHDEAAEVRPALVMEDDLGRALLDELARHYGGAVDVRTTREDLLAERKRTDKLTDALITIATRPTGGRP